jgi:ABC-type bacteriocin/lantibiotic exporter with double-glycine peptidase domain
MSTTTIPSFARRALARLVFPLALTLAGSGCASYEGTAKSAEPAQLMREGKWLMIPRFERVSQQKSQDCGAAALAAVLKYWGRDATPASVEAGVGGPRNSRLRAGDLVAYARREGLRSYVFFGTMDDVVYELRRGRPVIVGLGKAVSSEKALAHYQVVVGYEPKQERVLLLDPARGFQVDSLEGFSEEWKRSKGVTIVTFLPAPEPRISAN